MYSKMGRPGLFTDAQVATYAAQVACALRLAHRKHVIHRDIKPENILLGLHGEVKMGDWGWSIYSPDVRRTTLCGTPDYIAPEMIDYDRLLCSPIEPYNEKVDVWAVGILIYELLVGKTPFSEPSLRLSMLRTKRRDLHIPSYVPPDAADLIDKVSIIVEPRPPRPCC